MHHDLRKLAYKLGGDVAGSDTVLCPGPGHSTRDRSLAVRFEPTAPDGFVCHSHCDDDWKACRDLVRSRLGLPEWQPGDERQRTIPQQHIKKWDFAACDAEASDVAPAFDEAQLKRINGARNLWSEGERELRGTLAERYLCEHRKLALPDAGLLRFHPRVPWRNEEGMAYTYVPALLAPFTVLKEPTSDAAVMAVHRIALDPGDGSKRGRRMLGIVRATAIKLDPLDGDTLTVGEGLETCLAGRELGSRRAWALGSVGAISFFPVLDGVNVLRVLGENDAGASANAIEIVTQRWRAAGKRVRYVMPSDGFKDLNDVLIAERTAAS